MQVKERKIRCAVYKPTKITQIARNIIPGDKIHLGGGIRKASKKHGRVLNVEFLRVLQLTKDYLLVNPT